MIEESSGSATARSDDLHQWRRLNQHATVDDGERLRQIYGLSIGAVIRTLP